MIVATTTAVCDIKRLAGTIVPSLVGGCAVKVGLAYRGLIKVLYLDYSGQLRKSASESWAGRINHRRGGPVGV